MITITAMNRRQIVHHLILKFLVHFERTVKVCKIGLLRLKGKNKGYSIYISLNLI